MVNIVRNTVDVEAKENGQKDEVKECQPGRGALLY